MGHSNKVSTCTQHWVVILWRKVVTSSRSVDCGVYSVIVTVSSDFDTDPGDPVR